MPAIISTAINILTARVMVCAVCWLIRFARANVLVMF